MLRRNLIQFAIPLMVTGCTGFSLGENTAGGDTYLEYGEIAVDDRTEKAFVLNTFTNQSGAELKSVLRAVDPDSGVVSAVADLSDRDDTRILFPASGILVMSENGGTDELLLLDQNTFAEKAREDVGVRYHGTRMSSSREWIAVADNTAPNAPIHIIDTEILARRVIPHDGDWLEVMWLNGTDELFAIVFYLADSSVPDSKNHARILSWSMADVEAGKFEPGEDGFWPERKIDIDVEDIVPDIFFSFTWVGVSPDDKWAVFPVRNSKTSTNQLLVVETATGELRVVDDAKGPVGFTPDSSTIVSYDDHGSQNGPDGETVDGEVDQRLLLIDVNTLEVDPQEVDISGSISYFVSRDGNFVVVASNYEGEKLVLYDLDNDESTQMTGRASGLDEFVSRKGTNQLWLVDDLDLLKLDMNKGELSAIQTGYSVSRLNILPKHDWLVMSEPPTASQSTPRLHFFDPDTLKDVKAIDMP